MLIRFKISLNLLKNIVMANIKFFQIVVFTFLCFNLVAQPPAGYYDAANGLTGQPLRVALHDIISNGYISVSYNSLPTHYQTTDVKPNGKVWDMYSDIPGGTPPYEFTFTQTCGNYGAEGDCFNREHSVPQSWFNGASPMYSDLFHVVPTDGYVNNRRSNYPFGDVANASYTSMNGSKLGSSAVAGYNGTVFEPVDSFKGDFARIYFYMATRYKDEMTSWTGDPPFTSTDLSTWAINMFLQWNTLDPVSTKERQRNNSVYNIQHNRNPFVDNPTWANLIWGTASVSNSNSQSESVFVYPIPATNEINLNFSGNINYTSEITIQNINGKVLIVTTTYDKKHSIDISNLTPGIYFLTIKNALFTSNQKIVVVK